MPKVSCLYFDDSGTRNPNHAKGKNQYRDWFALGGIILNEEDEDNVRRFHEEFCKRWDITYPLHSIKIRSKSGEFSWLGTLDDPEYLRFMAELSEFVLSVPVVGHACVIDRPGYEARYREKYGRQQWMLCKTAFSVLCERSAKLAMRSERKLRIYPEAGDKTSDEALRAYYKALRDEGMPFKGPDSNKYAALDASQLKSTLYDLKFKNKSSPLAQLADLYLYPIARGGYENEYRPYKILVEGKKIIDSIISSEEKPHLGVKYSCFDNL